MNAFTNYLEKLGSNFVVSAMVPSLALVIACILVFDPILNVAAAFKDPQSTYQIVSFGLLVFIFTVIIGFTLTALNTFILKMFEGYVIFPPVRFLYNISRKIHLRKAQSMVNKRNELEAEVRRLESLIKAHPELEAELEELMDRYYKAAADYSLTYPDNLSDVLPTRFGNTLKAAENYSGERYGFDGVHFYPRLMQVIPVEYKLNIDTARNELSFLANMSILSVFFSFLCMFAIFISMSMVNGAGTDPAIFIEFSGTVMRYLTAAAVGFISCGFFYNASIFSVNSFGLMIRSSFDLFRMDLLKKLGLERPKDSEEEFNTWQVLNELIVLGSHSLSFKKLDYRKEE
ncbi:hypothetical protein FBQ99_21620 [Chloroflexi bacterium CFX2]|nr:hypothetical protein [Chloroflexi bacterium CFX2]